jgi:CRISPR-associated protein Csx17
MSEQDRIDWSKTTFDGSRREQLRRWRALTLRERLEALDRLTAHAERTRAASGREKAPQAEEPQQTYSASGGRNEIILLGCTPTPLASYLKALAVLRLVAEQAGDRNAAGCWRDDVFVLRTQFTEDELFRFFLELYEPTPIVAPWNAGSGFYFQEGKLEERDPVTGKRQKTGVRDQPTEATRSLAAIERSTATRFRAYREAIKIARDAIARFGLTKAPENKPERVKDAFIQYFRNVAADATLRWVDASLVLAEGEPEYPPLLGTGGNDGNLDFTANFMQNLAKVLNLDHGGAQPEAGALLKAALMGTPVAALDNRAIGQFAPGNAGGPNGSSGFEGNARINPWDFILMLEGALLFAAAAVRRLESSSGAVLSAPFTVRSRLSTEGAGAQSDDADARGEIWMPLWRDFWTIEEAFALFSEGRAALGIRPARDGLDFARAVARLGVDRGIRSFQRFGFLMRSGKAFLATPLARVTVRRNADADLIDDLEHRDWLAQVQRYARDDKTPGAFRSAAAQLDRALFALTQRASRVAVQHVLRQLGRIEALCATSADIRKVIGPVPTLSTQWVQRADDGSAEFRVALALAGLRLRSKNGSSRSVQLSLRPHLVPVKMDGTTWESEASSLICWGPGKIERNLAAVLHRRRLEAVRLGAEGELLWSTTGASVSDVLYFLDGHTDDRCIAELLAGLACADLAGIETPRAQAELRPAYALLKVMFTPESTLRHLGWLPPDRNLRLPAEIPARLAAGDVDSALTIAWQRLHALGAKLPGRRPPAAIALEGMRLLAALTIPLTLAETSRVVRWLNLVPEVEGLSETTF